MENKMTAVEWLIHILKGQQDKSFNFEEWMIAMEHGKEMEKQQHGDTWDAAIKAYRDRGHNVVRAIVDFDEYWKDKTNDEGN